MRMHGTKGFVGALALACGFGVSAVEVAGNLVVDLNMSNVTGIAEGGYIGTWVNQATGADKVGDFVPVNEGKGGKFARVNCLQAYPRRKGETIHGVNVFNVLCGAESVAAGRSDAA